MEKNGSTAIVGNQLMEAPKMQSNDSIAARPKALVIGLGEIGSSNAEYMSSLGLNVYGYDINEKAIKRALDAKIIRDRVYNFEGFDYYVICVSTHRQENMFVPYLDGLIDVARRLSREGKSGALVGIDSTIPRGTTQEVEKILGHRLHVVHVPHRYYVHEKNEHGVRQLRVIGACSKCCIEEGIKFYGELLNIPLRPVSVADVAELTKVTENAYRFMEIAFAEELKIVCDSISVDFNELREAVNTKWNTTVMEAKDGIGGHCLPKDSQMFLDVSNGLMLASLIRSAKMVDEQYRLHISLRPAREMAMTRG